jgi:AcrR family transcriptional regulator
MAAIDRALVLPAAPSRSGPNNHGHITEIQRKRVLTAMTEVCAERGSGNVSVAQVVGRAGVSRRTFYELFQDGEDCFLAAFDDALVRARRRVEEVYDPKARWLDRIRASLLALLSFFDEDRSSARLLVVESLRAGPLGLERRSRAIAGLVGAVDEAREESRGVAATLSPLMAESVVGALASVVHARLAQEEPASLLDLASQLMGILALPYLGQAAARRELGRAVPAQAVGRPAAGNPLGRLDMRLTYRTMRVLAALATQPGSSNRRVAEAAEIADQGQMSKLLARLQRVGLIENAGKGPGMGEPNAWTLTDKGWQVQTALAGQTGTG